MPFLFHIHFNFLDSWRNVWKSRRAEVKIQKAQRVTCRTKSLFVFNVESNKIGELLIFFLVIFLVPRCLLTVVKLHHQEYCFFRLP